MKSNQLAFKGVDSATRIAIKHFEESLLAYIDAHAAPRNATMGALASIFVRIGCPAIEEQVVTIDFARALLNEMRECLKQAVIRPELTAQDRRIVETIAAHSKALSAAEVHFFSKIPLSTVNQRLLVLGKKGALERFWRERIGYWMIPGRTEQRAPSAPSGSLLPNAILHLNHSPVKVGRPPVK